MGVATAVSAALAGSVVLLMAPRQVTFLHLVAANVSEQRFAVFPREKMVSAETPMFFLGSTLAIFGKSKDVVAPLVKTSIGVVNSEKWKEELAAKIENSVNLKAIFPVSELVIAYGDQSKQVGDFLFMKDVAEEFLLLNKKIVGKNIVPTVIIGSAADNTKMNREN